VAWERELWMSDSSLRKEKKRFMCYQRSFVCFHKIIRANFKLQQEKERQAVSRGGSLM
jgi:hypothetical protein